jgi:hypothetical protein
MKIVRPVRAACFGLLALASLVCLGFGLALDTWDDFPRRVVEFIGYLLFVVLSLETIDSCRRDSMRRTSAGRW